MDKTDEEFPKPVDSLPDGGIDLPTLRTLQQDSSINEIWIPRFGSLDEIDSDHEDVWETSIGFIPTSGIETFIVKRNDRIVTLEIGDEGWQVNEPIEKDEIHGQVFAHIIKPFVAIQRAVHHKNRD